MGFNIAGIVINKSYNNKIDELINILGFGSSLVFEKEIKYEEAIANWKENDTLDIYFVENGTFILMPIEMARHAMVIDNQNVLTFEYSEYAMAFTLHYYEGKRFVRKMSEFNGDKGRNRGEPLPEEEAHPELSEIIFAKIGNVLGQSFWSIDFEAKAFRCKF